MTVREIVSDAAVFAGACAVTFGAWQVYPPAGFIVGGLWGVVLGYLAAPEGDG